MAQPRDFFLSNTSISSGVWMGGLLATASLGVLTGLAALTHNKIAMIGALGVGAGLYPVIIQGFYNSVIENIKPAHGAVLKWFGHRMKGPEYERPEGDLIIVDWWNAVGKEVYDMHPRTLKLPPIPIETKDHNMVPTEITIRWQPKWGYLWYFGNNKENDLINAAIASVTAGVRVYGIAQASIEDLVGNNFAEALKEFIIEYLNRVASGELCTITITEDGGVFKATFTKYAESDPWGIAITFAEVPDFKLPANVTDAGSEVTEAKIRREAAQSLTETYAETMEKLIAQGVSPTAAMAQAHQIIAPDRTAPITVHGIAGYEPVIRLAAEAFATAMANRNPPANPT